MGKEVKSSKLIIQNGRRVAVGLSGGVDSSVCAAMLVEQGFDVTGVFLECWRAPGCRTDEDRKDALEIALELEIPFVVLDFKKEYYERVVEYFYREYEAGRTPNPDTMCNREIKFGLFYEWALNRSKHDSGQALGKHVLGHGFDYIATGHYARINKIDEILRLSGNSHVPRNAQDDNVALKSLATLSNDGKQHVLIRGIDPKKDQSYFLYQLRQEQLEHILFPVGGMTKKQVRREAMKRGMKTATKPDSQGICFIGPVDVKAFLGERIPPKRGELLWRMPSVATSASRRLPIRPFREPAALEGDELDGKILPISSRGSEGVVVGDHEGAAFYTVGERIGAGLDKNVLKELFEKGLFDYDPAEMPAMFVIEKDARTNTLVVGFEKDTYTDEFEVEQISWLVPDVGERLIDEGKTEVFVRVRNTGRLIGAELTNNRKERKAGVDDLQLHVKLADPEKGVASGQACVFYSDGSQDGVVLGGGIVVA